MEWIDETNYSQNDKIRKPTVFAVEHNNLKIIIAYGHREIGNSWCMHCYNLGINKKDLHIYKYDDIEYAKFMAIKIVFAIIKSYKKSIREIKKFQMSKS